MESPGLPAEVDSVLASLGSAGIRACVVGGALRDALLGREPRDFDIVVDAPLEQARRALPSAVAIGAHTPVLALLWSEPRLRVEVTERRGGAVSLEEDLRLRDFSLNALAWDPARREWLDPCGGREDLARRRLRACAPERCFRDDPVRLLRGVRLAVELHLETDPATARAEQRDGWRLSRAPGERLREELYRLLSLPAPVDGIEALRRSGALAGVLPELLRGVGVAQSRHHGDDVYRHTLAVCRQLRADPVLRLAGLLHDVAKPETKGFKGRGGDVSFHRHEHRAAEHIERVARRLHLSRRERKVIGALVRHHLLFPERLETERAIRRMLRRVGRDILPDLLELRRADLASRGPVPAEWDACETRIRQLEKRERETGRLAISGGDVMRELGIEHGPRVGRWLARARRRIVDQPQENERAKLLAWLRRAAEKE